MAASSAAATTAVGAAKAGAEFSAGIIRSIMDGLNRPIWSNSRVMTRHHIARNGDAIVETTTKGTTITVGFMAIILIGVLIWEVAMNWLSQQENNGGGTGPSPALIALSPGLWIAEEVASFFPHSNQTIQVPPSFMASLNQILTQASLPFLATAQQVGQPGAASINEMLSKFAENLQAHTK